MSTQYPIPRQTRQAILTATAAQTVFGPFDFVLFDPLDVLVQRSSNGGTTWSTLDPSTYTVVAAPPYQAFPAPFTLTFAAGQTAGNLIWVRGDRLPSRLTNVTRGGGIASALLEAELDSQAAAIQEIRRDNDAQQAALAASNPALLPLLASGVGNNSAASGGTVADALTGLNTRLGTVEGQVASYTIVADVAAAHIAVAVKFVRVAGALTAGDLGAALYRRVNSEPVLPGKIQSADGAWWLLAEAVVRPQMFGAKGDGVADDTAFVQAAISMNVAVHLPAGSYKITAPLTVLTKGQRITGDGPGATTLSVGTVFATGVIACATGDPGPILRDFGIAFTQADTAVRGNLTAYPPAIYAQNTPRLKIQNLLIQRAMVGIDLTGASGAADVVGLRCSAFTAAVKIDGALDSMRFEWVDLNNWGCTVNQTVILQDPATLGFTVGRCDGLKISDGLVLVGTGLNAFTGATGSISGEISGTGFDTLNGIVMASGFLVVADSYFSMKGSSFIAINMTGGDLTLAGCRVNDAGTGGAGNACIVVASGASFTWLGGVAQLGAQDRALVKSFNTTTSITIGGVAVVKNANIAYGLPVVWKTAGRATIYGCAMVAGVGTGSGAFIEIDTDDYDVVTNNAANNGWTYSFPASPTKGIYAINGGGAPLPVALGGTASAAASGTALDNITGFSATGFLKRTGAGAYSFIADPLPGANGGTGVANTGKTVTLGASVTTTGAGAPTLAFPASPFTYTFQGSSDTLVGLATTDTLTNKTLVTPTITTSATVPLVIGGTATSATLTLESTSGAGATDAIILKTASQAERVRVTSGGFVNIGPNVTPDSLLTVMNNAAATVAPPAGTVVHIVGADGGNPIEVLVDAFGGQPIFGGRRAQGTLGAKTGVVAGNILMRFGGDGWNGSAYTTTAAFASINARETWSGTANGADITFNTTPLTTAAFAEAMRIQASGGVSIGTTTDGGLGSLVLAGKLRCASFVVASLPAGSAAGETVYASNCRVFNGAGVQEGAAAGTGGLVNYNGTAWKIAGTNVTAVA